MTDTWRSLFLASVSAIILVAIGCGKDPAPSVCQPRALTYETDSVIFNYVDGRVTMVSYYASGIQVFQDDLTYNSIGRLAVITKSNVSFEGIHVLQSQHALTYGDDGRPTILVTNSSSGYFTTNFTHNSEGRLALLQTSSGIGQEFLGSTRYEYDGDGNISNVYYSIWKGQKVTEVLARENLAFDGTGKFYKNTEELKIIYEYIYGYLPCKNNCLSATVHYYNYMRSLNSPLSISFAATYENDGYIKSLQSEGSGSSSYSGEVLFKNVLYDCH